MEFDTFADIENPARVFRIARPRLIQPRDHFHVLIVSK